MVKQFLKKKSKRQSTKHRVKVERKVREHKRKLKKEERKNPKKGKTRDPGIPNTLPFKDEVLREVVAYKEKREQEREKKKASRKKAREQLQNQKRNLADVMKDAEKRQAAYDKQQDHGADKGEQHIKQTSSSKVTENSRKTFYKEVKKVIEAADVILEVLDARDPLGSRCLEVEEIVRSSPGNKRLVLLLNKIDLVPKENVEVWLKHLRKELPAIAFKASTQQQRDHLAQTKVDYLSASAEMIKSSNCLGADMLLKLLRNYCRSTEMAINVGVIGFPNTGKSSIINSLKRSKACDVGAIPGITRTMQSVHLDKHIKLLDSPGVVLSTSPSDIAAILRNVVKIESVDDPLPAVEAILSRCQKTQMMIHYNLPDYSDASGFLSLLAQRMGKLKKGGIPDTDRAARTMLQDWNNGKITYYTAPPEESTVTSHHIDAKIVTEWSKEFNIDELIADETKLIAVVVGDFVEEIWPQRGLYESANRYDYFILIVNEFDEFAANQTNLYEHNVKNRLGKMLLDTRLDFKNGKENGGPILVSSLGPLKAVVRPEDLEVGGDNDIDLEDPENDDLSDEEMEEEVDEELKGVTVSAGSKQKSVKQLPIATEVRPRGPPPKIKLVTVGGLTTKKSKKLAEKKEKKKKRRADTVAGKLSDALTSALEGLGAV